MKLSSLGLFGTAIVHHDNKESERLAKTPLKVVPAEKLDNEQDPKESKYKETLSELQKVLIFERNKKRKIHRKNRRQNHRQLALKAYQSHTSMPEDPDDMIDLFYRVG